MKPELIKTISTRIVSSLSNILVCAGLSRRPIEAGEAIIKGVGSKMDSVTAMAYKLSEIIGQEITSSNMRVTSVAETNGKYDGILMDNGYGEAKPGDRVICTIELGLVMGKGDEKEKVLLKPKVALEGFLDS